MNHYSKSEDKNTGVINIINSNTDQHGGRSDPLYTTFAKVPSSKNVKVRTLRSMLVIFVLLKI